MMFFNYTDVTSNELSYKLKSINVVIHRTTIAIYQLWVFTIFTIILIARYSAFLTVYNPAYTQAQASFIFDDKKITTNESYRYVGKSKGYIFFYHTDTGFADAFDLGDVKSLSIKETKPYIRINIKPRGLPRDEAAMKR